jgi:LysW-gamma-L-lysine carboxypeptidase
VAFWLQVQEYLRRQNGRQGRPFDRLDVSLRRLNSSEAGGYGAAHMQMVFRLPVGMDPYLLEEELRPLARQARLSFAGHEAAYLAPKNTPLVRALLRSIRRCQGDPKFVVKTGTSDMNVVGPVWDCPIAAYGPGDAALDHTPYEHIDLAEFSRAVEVLRGALQEMLFQLAR